MGHLVEPEILAEVGEVGKELGDAPVVGLEERLEGQDGEQLVGGEVFAAAGRGVGRQGFPGESERLPGDGPGGLGHGGWGLHTPFELTTRPMDSTEHCALRSPAQPARGSRVRSCSHTNRFTPRGRERNPRERKDTHDVSRRGMGCGCPAGGETRTSFEIINSATARALDRFAEREGGLIAARWPQHSPASAAFNPCPIRGLTCERLCSFVRNGSAHAKRVEALFVRSQPSGTSDARQG